MKPLAALTLIALQTLGWSAGTTAPLSRLLAAPSSHSAQPAVIAPQALPVQITDQPLTLTAGSAAAYDLTTMTPLYLNNADQPRPIASLTKMATVLVYLHDHPATTIVTIGHLPTYTSADELLGLKTGQHFDAQELIAAALVPSDDDAADALAIADAGSQPAFIAKMNAWARALHLNGTHFASTSGLIDTDNTSTAHDLAIIGQLILASPTARGLIDQTSITIHDTAGQSYPLTSTDTLLASGEFSGIKTGYTDAAGQCFVGLTTINGHQILTVVLGSTDRFGDTQLLRDWVARNYQWQTFPPSS